MAETITSASNPLLKDVRRAIARGGLTDRGWCVAESFHLLDEALRSGCSVEMVLAAESARNAAEDRLQGRGDVRLALLPDTLFQKTSGTESAQGVMALVTPPAWSEVQLFEGNALLVVLDGLQDPGNAGAIVRAAEAFCATGVIFVKGTVSPYNPKTLRASAGSLFRVPTLHGMDAASVRAALSRNQVQAFAAVPHGNCVTRAADLTSNCALVIGNEARGVSGELRSDALDVSIPTVGVESLNAAVAAGILLYEASRQRTARL